MRLLMLAHTITPWTPLYARWFVARGDAVRVVSMSPDPIPGVETEFIGVEPFDKYRRKHLFVTRVPRVRAIIRSFRPDVVFATYLISNGLTAALAWSGPIVLSAQGGDVREMYAGRSWRNAVRHAVIRYVCRRAVAIHSVSQELSDRLVALGIPREKIHQAASGVDLRVFRPAPDAPRTVARRIICIRKHEPVYDIPTLIDALAMLRRKGRDFECTSVGGGHLLDEHRRRATAAGLGDSMTFAGPVAHESLPQRLRDADVYVTPAVADGTSASLLEGMASGLFPIGTRIPANTAWIDDGRTGLLYTPRRADELAAALERALDDSELRRSAFDANRRRVERDGDLERNMQRLAAVIDAAASPRGGAAASGSTVAQSH